jgi:hypothetical protein
MEELGLPREISVAPGTDTADRKVPLNANAPHVVVAASEQIDACDVVAPLLEYLPSHWPIVADFETSRVVHVIEALDASVFDLSASIF